jgi:hypothetical protein
LLISWCVGDRCDMAGNDKDLGRNRRPGAENWGWLRIGRVLGGRMIGRSGDAMCSLYHVQGDVASSQILCGDKAKNRWVYATGCIELFYLNFTIFIVLGHKGS